MNISHHNEPADFARILLRLIQGPLYDDDSQTWSELELYQNDVRDYLSMIGIDLVINEREGYAFLTQDIPELEGEKLPRIIRRRALSYEVTLLCVILFQKLLEFDAKDTDSRKLFLTHSQIQEEAELLFPEGNDQSRLLEKIDSYINAVCDLGYLTRVRKSNLRSDQEPRYEVRRIIKARFRPEDLERIKNTLSPETTEEHEHAADDVS